MLLSVASAFRTTFDEAVLVVMSTIPVGTLVKETSGLYYVRRKELTQNVPTHELWQRRWDEFSKGRWKHGLIPKVRV